MPLSKTSNETKKARKHGEEKEVKEEQAKNTTLTRQVCEGLSGPRGGGWRDQ